MPDVNVTPISLFIAFRLIIEELLPDVVKTSCKKCSPRQRRFARKVVDAFNKYLPASHDKLKKKLDPENKYYGAFEKSLADALRWGYL